MAKELSELGELISKMELDGETVEQAIAATEHRLKLLRTVKAMLKPGSGEKVRTKKKETVGA